MKIVFTLAGNGPEQTMDRRFGRAPGFLLHDTETGERQFVANDGIEAAHGAGIKAAETIANLGAQVLVTGDCGVKAMHVLRQAGIKVYSTDAATADEALAAFRAGRLAELANA